MSKSLGDKHYVGLFEPEESIRKKIRSAVTDVGGQPGEAMSPGVLNLFTIIKACEKKEAYKALMDEYNHGTLKYRDLKEVTAEALLEVTHPLRQRREELRKNPDEIKRIVFQSSEKARDLAERTLNDVRELTGLVR
jgi:tryptophanyl-tRNA synthetase